MSKYTCLERSEFDLEIAVLLAEASQAAYANSVALTTWANDVGFGEMQTFDRGDVQGFFCSAPSVTLLVFRGTSNLGQWLRDAQFAPWPHPWGFVHRGFLDGVEAVEVDLEKFDAAAKSAEHVWVTGHSLGGALAVIAAARLKIRGITCRLCTYGQPRVGFSNFADRFSIELPGKLLRFVNQSDIVPRVPPGLLYRHTGLVKRIVRPGVLEMVPTLESLSSTDPSVSSQIEAVRHTVSAPALDAANALKAAGVTEPLLIDTDLAPLTETEFAQLQIAFATAESTPQLESLTLDLALPWISDHAISEYIRLLKEIPHF